MRIASPPERCLAIVVGIERYDATEYDWTLRGPAIDALSIALWLRGRGLPARHLRLFVNFADGVPQAGSREAVAVAALAGDGVVCQPPLQNALFKVLSHPQPLAAEAGAAAGDEPDVLIVYWSGHGVVDDVESGRALYTSDATDEIQLAIGISSHLRQLEKDEQLGRRFRQQLVIVDACGQWTSQRDREPKFMPAYKPREPYSNDTDQFALWATEEGQLARVAEAGGLSVYTAALLDALPAGAPGGAPAADTWPDMNAVHEALVETFRDSGQRPVLRRKRPRRDEDTERFERQSAMVRELATIFSGSAMPLSRLRPLFAEVAPPDRRMPDAAGDSVRALARLVEADERNAFPRIARYALRARHLCHDLARSDAELSPGLLQTAQAIDAWAKFHVDLPAWGAEDERLRARRNDHRHLVIDVPPHGMGSIDAALHPGDPRFVWAARDAATPVAEVIRDAIQLARTCIDGDLVIELRVPIDRLSEGLDRQVIEYDVDGDPDWWTLGRDFVTVLGVRDRSGLHKPALTKAWRDAWPGVRQTVDLDGASLRWLDAPAVPLVYGAYPCDTWVGLPVPPLDGLEHRTFVQALRRGAPLMVWPTAGAPDRAALKPLADQLVAASLLHTFPGQWKAAVRKDPRLADLHVLFDDPTRFTDDDGLAPVKLHNPEQRTGR